MTRFDWDIMRTIWFNMIYALVLSGFAFVAAFLFGFSLSWKETTGFLLAVGFLAALCQELSALKAKVEQLERANSAQSQESSSLSSLSELGEELSELREELLDLKSRIPEPRFG